MHSSQSNKIPLIFNFINVKDKWHPTLLENTAYFSLLILHTNPIGRQRRPLLSCELSGSRDINRCHSVRKVEGTKAHAHGLLWPLVLCPPDPRPGLFADPLRKSEVPSGVVGNVWFSSILHVGSRNMLLSNPFSASAVSPSVQSHRLALLQPPHVSGAYSERLHPPRSQVEAGKKSLLTLRSSKCS